MQKGQVQILYHCWQSYFDQRENVFCHLELVLLPVKISAHLLLRPYSAFSRLIVLCEWYVNAGIGIWYLGIPWLVPYTHRDSVSLSHKTASSGIRLRENSFLYKVFSLSCGSAWKLGGLGRAIRKRVFKLFAPPSITWRFSFSAQVIAFVAGPISS